ncbi:MAG: malto-oligosyltrehalose synthase, partial [bacterium]
IAAHVEFCTAALNRTAGAARLHQLLEAQPYRLAYWRTASHEINYRRFFDINELAGLRMEDPEVFAATHVLLLALLAERGVTGVRLDHVDGLYDPAGYLADLQRAARSAGGPAPLFLVVEKILGADETLPAAWPVAGTTGYDFLNDCLGLFVDRQQQRTLQRIYRRFTSQRVAFADRLYDSKMLIMDGPMASELNMLAVALNRLSEHDPRTRDFTLNSLRDTLREVVACFPVYRTYVNADGASAGDRRTVDTALARVRRRHPTMEPSILAFVRSVLLPEPTARDYDRRLHFAMRFQQYTGPVEAKGREDTSFYRYVPMVALNEVGGDPARFGRTPAEFHAAALARHIAWPHAMLATATHDTKRGEDARLRLAALSELSEEWGHRLSAWTRVAAAHRSQVEGAPAPDRNDEYLFYQALLGAWPQLAVAADTELLERLVAFAVKAAREAKRHTSWLTENAAYEAALGTFIRGLLGGRSAARFLPLFLPFQARVAALGAVNGLAQTVLKCVAPGIPDFYQGCELWDLSLVDPDNRRAVDYGLRERLLGEIDTALADGTPRAALAGELLNAWQDGRIKLLLTALLLRLRRERASLFRSGDYVALETRGQFAAHVVAFARRAGAQVAITVVPRLCAALTSAQHPFPLGARWEDTAIALPSGQAGPVLRDVLTGAEHAPKALLPLAELLSVLPVSVLTA